MSAPDNAQPFDVRVVARSVPPWVTRLLYANCGNGLLGGVLKRRRTLDVHGIENDSHLAALASQLLDSVTPWGTRLDFPERSFDGVVLFHRPGLSVTLAEALTRVEPYLTADAVVLVVFPNAHYWKNRAVASAGYTPDDVFESAAWAGFLRYHYWGELDDTGRQLDPYEENTIQLDGQTLRVTSHHEIERLFAPTYIVQIAHRDYDPTAHARRLAELGRPDWAYEILLAIPPTWPLAPEEWAAIKTHMIEHMLGWDGSADPLERMTRFLTSQCRFYEIAREAPAYADAYCRQAEFWRRIGNDDMAARLLRSLHYVAPSPKLTEALEHCHPERTRPIPDDQAPEWTQTTLPRMLMITHPRPHYGLDILYDGLCALCGDENVVEFPWKGTLHGVKRKAQANYPCSLNRAGEPLELDQLLTELREGRFDFVLYGDLECSLEQPVARQIAEAARDVPLIVLDAQDHPLDRHRPIADFLGRDDIRAYFKREMLACVDYPPNTFPFPFAFLDERVPQEVPEDRDLDVFWAGNRQSGLRRLYLEHIERILGVSLAREYEPEEYRTALLRSRIGINIFGWGYDTVRYWELPAHGCMLLSERLPIRIPHNFEDGVSAVFFDDTQELEEKLKYYLAHPGETAAIARAGRDHLLRHHTASARARQVLGWIQQVLSTR